MPHIHTKPGEHDLTVSAFILRTDGIEPRLILHMHKKLKRYMQFGGHVELYETPWQAIRHEIAEESGYDFSQLQLLQPRERMKSMPSNTLHPQPLANITHLFKELDHYHTDLVYAFVTSDKPANKIGDEESSDIRLLTLAELKELSDEQTYPDIRDIASYIFETCLPNWERCNPDDWH